MAVYWVVWKPYRVWPDEFRSQLGEVEALLPVYRTKRDAQRAHGYTVEMSKVDTKFSKKGMWEEIGE